jgi:ABC-type glucose/galactose transport system permease subunit
VGDAVCNDFDGEALGIADGLVPGFAVAHHPRNLQSFGDPSAVFLAVQVNRQIHLFIIPPQSADPDRLATRVILEHTRLGRYAFAIGSNPDAAVYAGVPVAFDTTVIYALGGLLTGLAGMIEASRLMTGQPSAGNGYELQAIAAVVIGGGSLHGGEGSVIGTLIGALIMGLLSNGSDLLGISPYLQQAIIGAVIILAVTVDELRKRRGRADA